MRRRATRLKSVPVWVSLVLLIATGTWVAYAGKAIEPHNQMRSRLEKPPLPIRSVLSRPVMQLEFVRGAEDVRAILQVGSTAEQHNIDDVRRGNELDTKYLIPGYAAFLIVLGLFVAQGSRSSGALVFLAAVATTVVIAGADIVENNAIESVLDALKDDAAAAAAAATVSTAAFVKWTLLGLLLIFLGVAASLSETRRHLLTPFLFLGGMLFLAIVGRHAVERFLT